MLVGGYAYNNFVFAQNAQQTRRILLSSQAARN